MARRPSVTVPCVADGYADKQRERIIEFFDGPTQQGGLIAFRRQDNGSLDVSLYNLDPLVTVTTATKKVEGNAGMRVPAAVEDTAIVALRGLVNFVTELDRAHCGLEDFKHIDSGIEAHLAAGKAVLEVSERKPPTILVIVEGGIVQEVLSTPGNIAYELLDWDIAETSDEKIDLSPEALALLSDEAQAMIVAHNAKVPDAPSDAINRDEKAFAIHKATHPPAGGPLTVGRLRQLTDRITGLLPDSALVLPDWADGFQPADSDPVVVLSDASIRIGRSVGEGTYLSIGVKVEALDDDEEGDDDDA